MDAKIIKQIAPPGIIAAILLFGLYGPLRGGFMKTTLETVDQLSASNLEYPAVFWFGVGLAIAWAIYAINVFILQRRRTAARTALVRLRKEGTQLRIECAQLSTLLELTTWVAKTVSWEDRTIKALAQISEPDSEFFATIDVPNEPRRPLDAYLSQDHRDHHAFHDTRLVRLQDLYMSYR